MHNSIIHTTAQSIHIHMHMAIGSRIHGTYLSAQPLDRIYLQLQEMYNHNSYAHKAWVSLHGCLIKARATRGNPSSAWLTRQMDLITNQVCFKQDQ